MLEISDGVGFGYHFDMRRKMVRSERETFWCKNSLNVMHLGDAESLPGLVPCCQKSLQGCPRRV